MEKDSKDQKRNYSKPPKGGIGCEHVWKKTKIKHETIQKRHMA